MFTSLLTAIALTGALGTGGPDILPNGTVIAQRADHVAEAQLVRDLLRGPVDPFCDGCEFSYTVSNTTHPGLDITVTEQASAPGACEILAVDCEGTTPCTGTVKVRIDADDPAYVLDISKITVGGSPYQPWDPQEAQVDLSSECGASDDQGVEVKFEGARRNIINNLTTNFVFTTTLYASCTPCEAAAPAAVRFHQAEEPEPLVLVDEFGLTIPTCDGCNFVYAFLGDSTLPTTVDSIVYHNEEKNLPGACLEVFDQQDPWCDPILDCQGKVRLTFQPSGNYINPPNVTGVTSTRTDVIATYYNNVVFVQIPGGECGNAYSEPFEVEVELFGQQSDGTGGITAFSWTHTVELAANCSDCVLQ